MEATSVVVRLTSLELYVNSGLLTNGYTERDLAVAANVPTNASGYEAVAIDPSSHFRQVYVFLDDSYDPIPLVGGEVLRARFTRLKVTPFYRASWETGSLSSSVFNSPPPYNNQVLALRLFTKRPAQSHLTLPPSAFFVQDVLTTLNLATLPATFLYHLHAPGARSITFFASNHNTANPPATVSVSISACRPEVPAADPLVTTHWASTHNKTFGTLVIPTAAAEYTTTVTVVDPGFSEYYFWNGSTTTPGVYTLHLGCIVTFY